MASNWVAVQRLYHLGKPLFLGMRRCLEAENMVVPWLGKCPECAVPSNSWTSPPNFHCLKHMDPDSQEMKRAEELAGSSLVPKAPEPSREGELKNDSKLFDCYMKIIGKQLDVTLLGENFGRLLDDEEFGFDDIAPLAIVNVKDWNQLSSHRDCQGLSEVVEVIQFVRGELYEAHRMIVLQSRGIDLPERIPRQPEFHPSTPAYIGQPLCKPNPFSLLRAGHAGAAKDWGTYRISVGLEDDPMMDAKDLTDDIKRRTGDIQVGLEPNCCSAEWSALVKEEKCDQMKIVFGPDAFYTSDSFEYQLRLQVIVANLRLLHRGVILSHSEEWKRLNKPIQEGGAFAVAEEA